MHIRNYKVSKGDKNINAYHILHYATHTLRNKI